MTRSPSPDAAFRGVVALDGPSGTGKSTVARRLAGRLGAAYLDTGAMYRAATLAVLRRNGDPGEAGQVLEIVRRSRITVSTDPGSALVELDSDDVSAEIRSASVTAAVSAVSAVAEVRTLLVTAQRALIERALADGGMVAEGRDIGSVVWPAARPKVYLTASAAARAARRAAESGPTADVATVAADIDRRDRFDSTRAASPLTQVADAVVLDTTELDVDQVVDRLAALARATVGDDAAVPGGRS